MSDINLTKGATYRGRICLDYMNATISITGQEGKIKTSLESAGFTDVQVWKCGSSDLPADWPDEARADICPKACRCIQATWNKDTGTYPGQGNGWQIIDVWPESVAPGSTSTGFSCVLGGCFMPTTQHTKINNVPTATTPWSAIILGVGAVALLGFGANFAFKKAAKKNPVKKEILGRDRFKERDRGAKFFYALPIDHKWELGDQFVLGTYDWTEWFDSKPSSDFIRGVDDARMNWEMSLE